MPELGSACAPYLLNFWAMGAVLHCACACATIRPSIKYLSNDFFGRGGCFELRVRVLWAPAVKVALSPGLGGRRGGCCAASFCAAGTLKPLCGSCGLLVVLADLGHKVENGGGGPDAVIAVLGGLLGEGLAELLVGLARRAQGERARPPVV